MTGDQHVLSPSSLTYEAFLDRAIAEPDVIGLVLKGSHTHDGMATEHSDHDVYLILADAATTDLAALDGYRSAALDVVVTTVEALRHCAGLERYALARARVLLDRTGGEITEIIAAKGRLGPEEAHTAAANWLDAYANWLYRSVKNARDGRSLAAHLDAAESIGYLLELLFALDRRPRPYNKYLAWELERFPLPGWDTGVLLETIGQIQRTGDVSLQQRLFAQVEVAARAAGHAPTLDAWGEDLLLMRPTS
ncbi:hypothetical protein [Kitasatospora aureofaciens]|uniref:hypothetical protein n=1 Tax=Kitasatospora aureofaciens TaxID=1894 RepID=UPI00382258DE